MGCAGGPGLSTLNPDSRRRAIEAAGSGELDLLVIGGGITGAGAALDAATRGLSVALVEARDLASGTSSASSKLIHGGLRYLEMGDFGLVREALRERELLLTRLAPHLVSPVAFLWPLRGRAWERAYLGAGLALYDTLGGARSVPRHRHLGRRGALLLAPALREDALVGAVQFHDAAEDDARMVLAVARTAAAHGAQIATRVRVTGFRGPGLVDAVDEETGEPLALRARHVAGAAGVWTDELRRLAGGVSSRRIVPSKGIHIFVARERLALDTGLLARTEKSVLFVIPWQGGWLIGDTDTPWRHGPGEPVATAADIDYLLAKTNALLRTPLGRDDIHGVIAGLRPLVAGGGAVRHHAHQPQARRRVARPGPDHDRGRQVHDLPGDGGRSDRRGGVAPSASPATSVTRDVPLLDARPPAGEEAAYACTDEGALHLEDFLERRTRLALTAPDRGLATAAPAASAMAGVLGWSRERERAEVDGWHARVARAPRRRSGTRRRAGAGRVPRRARRGRDRVIVLGLDQGTSSTRCVALDRELREVGSATVPVACAFPGPGLVEQDPEALAESARAAIAGALGGRNDVAALGIANQTETFVVWDRATGRAVHPAIVWQDRRTDAECAALRRSTRRSCASAPGSSSTPTFPATKLRWVLDRAGGELAYGDVGSWLLHRLAGVHVTDAGNAGRSLLCPLGGSDWDDDLLALFGVPRSLLPPIVDTDAVAAAIDGVPVRAVAGDQQASLFGLRCWSAGEAKVTLGTGAFVLANAGHEPPAPPDGVLASTAWRIGGRTTFALEGFVPTAGAALDWFARIGALPAGPELDALLREAGPGAGVVCVPALQGLGTPSWDAATRGALFGIDLGTTRADLARAVVDGVLHQVADALDVAPRPSSSASTEASPARPGSSSGSPTCPASASSAPHARTRRRSAPRCSRGWRRGCGSRRTRCRSSGAISSPSRRWGTVSERRCGRAGWRLASALKRRATERPSAPPDPARAR